MRLLPPVPAAAARRRNPYARHPIAPLHRTGADSGIRAVPAVLGSRPGRRTHLAPWLVPRPVPHRPAAAHVAVDRQVPRPVLNARPPRGAVARHPRDCDQAGRPFVPVGAALRVDHVWSDTWQHHGPPCTARDLSVRLDVDVTIGSRTVHDCAEGPIRADHEITAIWAA